MSLTIGVLTHNSATTLPDLLDSLPAGLAGVDRWQLVISDSGSLDGTLDVARRLAPDAKIVELGANRGFAAAANAAITADRSTDAVLILSPRVRLRPGCVRAMLGTLADTGAGIVVPRLYSGTGERRDSLRHRLTVPRALAAAVVGGTLANRLGPLANSVTDPAAYRRTTAADWATGAATMISRACVEATGPFDESFFLYSEEVEFELRAADHGFRLVLAPGAEAVHLGGESRLRADLYAIQVANQVRLGGMRDGRGRATLHWLAALLGETIRSAPRSAGIHRHAAGKLVRERAALIAGRPARIERP